MARIASGQVKVNTRQVAKKILESPALAREAKNRLRVGAEISAIGANNKMISDFQLHPVTKEIQAGPEYQGPSVLPYGNLFSFLGFEYGADPTAVVLAILENSIKVRHIRKVPSRPYFVIKIDLPSKEEIFGQTPLDWADKSWVEAIESGVSGLGYYLQSDKGFRNSRSQFGIQSKRQIRGGSFTPQKYISTILNDAERYLRSNLRRSV